MKKIIFAVTGVIMSCALLAGNSFAAPVWTKCDAAQVGPFGSVVRVQLTGCTLPGDTLGGWVTLSSTGTDQMMATMLTAMSLNKQVTVQTDVDSKASGYLLLNALILSK